MHDQHENQPACADQPVPLAPAEPDEAAMHRAIADDLHALALVVAAALSGPLASEWHAL